MGVRLGRIAEQLRRSPSALRAVFGPTCIDGLPSAARRHLSHAITPGTRLATCVRLSMHGHMRLKRNGSLLPMRAVELLAPPQGFIWRARVGRFPLIFNGFDLYYGGRGEMNWRLLGLVPVVTLANGDIARAAAGRLAGEAIFLPSVLLPHMGTSWLHIDDDRASFAMNIGGEVVQTTITVDSEGRLTRAILSRWRADARARQPYYDTFAVDGFSDERTFGGYTIPCSFRAGWRLGEDAEFPFFFATIESATYD